MKIAASPLTLCAGGEAFFYIHELLCICIADCPADELSKIPYRGEKHLI